MGAFVARALGDREPINLRERAYDRFTRHLLARDLKAGQFISQRELVELTQLPLGAIRELIPRLEAEGLVRTVPQRGMHIAHVDLSLIRDAYQLRLFLEREAIQVFTAQAPDNAIAAMREAHVAIIAECERALAAGGIPTTLIDRAQDIDWALHATIIDGLKNAIVTDIYRVNAIKIRLITQEQARLNNAVVIPTMREHLAVIEAVASRDGLRAAEAITAHITSARDRATGWR